jgi:hypothetical protein
MTKCGGLVRNRKPVTPAKAGVQNYLNYLDSRFRGNDKKREIAAFCKTKCSFLVIC